MRKWNIKVWSSLTKRQKMIASLSALTIILLIGQAKGLTGYSDSKNIAKAASAKKTMKLADNTTTSAPMPTPTPAQLPPSAPVVTTTTTTTAGNATSTQASGTQPMSQREMDLVKLQQGTQDKYITAMNELQMLRLEREMAETNQAIMAAKLASVTSQKGIVDLLTKPAEPAPTTTFTVSGSTPTEAPNVQGTPPAPPSETITYNVVSVFQIQNKWSAVVGSAGKLFTVNVGDILPPDGSKILSINKSGITIMQAHEKKKVSLVSSI